RRRCDASNCALGELIFVVIRERIGAASGLIAVIVIAIVGGAGRLDLIRGVIRVTRFVSIFLVPAAIRSVGVCRSEERRVGSDWSSDVCSSDLDVDVMPPIALWVS